MKQKLLMYNFAQFSDYWIYRGGFAHINTIFYPQNFEDSKEILTSNVTLKNKRSSNSKLSEI